jgi:hypothetical protein
MRSSFMIVHFTFAYLFSVSYLPKHLVLFLVCSLNMAAKYIVSALMGSFAIAFVCDHFLADKKIFGGKFFFCP